MTRRTYLLVAVAVLITLAAAFALRLYLADRERHRMAVRPFTGTLSYNCSTADVTDIVLTEQRSTTGNAKWSVQRPGEKPIPAAIYPVEPARGDVRPIGGWIGLRWRGSDGRTVDATLSFNDIVEAYGPKDALLRIDNRSLLCLPDPASYRDAP